MKNQLSWKLRLEASLFKFRKHFDLQGTDAMLDFCNFWIFRKVTERKFAIKISRPLFQEKFKTLIFLRLKNPWRFILYPFWSFFSVISYDTGHLNINGINGKIISDFFTKIRGKAKQRSPGWRLQPPAYVVLHLNPNS